MTLPPVRSVLWKRVWRVIPTLYPEEAIYAPIAANGDWSFIQDIERHTNSGVRQEKGETLFIRQGDTLPKGKSAYNIGRPFAFPTPSRFSDGTYGVFYAARDLITAAIERAYHTEKFMTFTSQPATTLKQRVLTAQIHGRFHDLRPQKAKWKSLYHASNYSASQKLGKMLWDRHSAGILYDSVRHAKGECAAVFSPQTITFCRQDRCLQFEWDGRKISHMAQLEEFPS